MAENERVDFFDMNHESDFDPKRCGSRVIPGASEPASLSLGHSAGTV